MAVQRGVWKQWCQGTEQTDRACPAPGYKGTPTPTYRLLTSHRLQRCVTTTTETCVCGREQAVNSEHPPLGDQGARRQGVVSLDYIPRVFDSPMNLKLSLGWIIL